ncbi:MAG: flagellar FliJ family protein [Rhodospirillales bacterium]|nr:flagellar FliJ family protein [Rhodospirillales bacterium]
MARGLETLIRLNEWSVDQKRRKLGEVLGLIDGFKGEASKLESDLIKEQAVAAASPNEAGFLYGYYADATIDRRAIIQISIQQLETQADAAREEVNQAYRELKKYETALETRKKRETAERDRQDQLALDEVGMQSFIQKRA